MSTINVKTREVALKIVYYGPGLCGKTTSLQAVHSGIPEGRRPTMVSLATEEDRTLYFDFLPVVAAKLGDYTVRLQLYTVPGQVFYNSTRKLVLQGADGVVFVADSQPAARDANIESYGNLEENLAEWGQSLATIPHVLQLNKRDIPEVMSAAEMVADLNQHGAPVFETVASRGEGVYDALKELVRLVVKKVTDEGFKKSATRSLSTPPPPPAPAPAAESIADSIASAVEQVTPARDPVRVTGVSYASVWDASAMSFGTQIIEELIGERKYAEAVVKTQQLVNLAVQAGGYRGEQEALFALLCGVNGPSYRRYRATVARALRDKEITQRDALFVLHFAIGLAFG